MGRIQNTSGSWLHTIGRVTGVPKLSITDLRRGAEKHIQNDEEMRRRCKALNFHSEEVGRVVYDERQNMQIRGEYVHKVQMLESGEGPSIESEQLTDFEKKRLERKRKLEIEDEQKRIAKASQFLQLEQEKRNNNVVYSKRIRVLPNDRKFLQELFSTELFPEDKNFTQGNLISLFRVICY